VIRVCVWCEKKPPPGSYGLGTPCPNCYKALVLKEVPEAAEVAALLDELVAEHLGGDATPEEVDRLEREVRENYPKVKCRWERYVSAHG
jgi:hypothetical protein